MAAPWVKFKFTIDAGRPFRNYLAAARKALSAWTANGVGQAALTALEQHHAAIYASAGAHGLAGYGSGTGAWAALRARTLKARALRMRTSHIAPYDYKGSPVSGAGILVWAGRLRDSVSTPGNMNGDAIRRINRNGVVFGTSDPTAEKHLVGEGGIPIRSPIDPVVGPTVAIDAIEARILAILTSSDLGVRLSSPGMIPSAAGFYVRQR